MNEFIREKQRAGVQAELLNTIESKSEIICISHWESQHLSRGDTLNFTVWSYKLNLFEFHCKSHEQQHATQVQDVASAQ